MGQPPPPVSARTVTLLVLDATIYRNWLDLPALNSTVDCVPSCSSGAPALEHGGFAMSTGSDGNGHSEDTSSKGTLQLPTYFWGLACTFAWVTLVVLSWMFSCPLLRDLARGALAAAVLFGGYCMWFRQKGRESLAKDAYELRIKTHWMEVKLEIARLFCKEANIKSWKQNWGEFEAAWRRWEVTANEFALLKGLLGPLQIEEFIRLRKAIHDVIQEVRDAARPYLDLEDLPKKPLIDRLEPDPLPVELDTRRDGEELVDAKSEEFRKKFEALRDFLNKYTEYR